MQKAMIAESVVDNLAFAETSEEVENILCGLSIRDLKSSGVSWVALEIDADISLRENGINPILPVDLISIEDRKNIFLDAMDWSVHWLDEINLDYNKIIFKKDLSLADFVRNNVYRYFSHIFYLISVLEKAVKNFGPKTLVFSANRPEIVHGLDHSTEYYLRRIARAVAHKHNLKVLEIDDTPTRRKARLRQLPETLFRKSNSAVLRILTNNIYQNVGPSLSIKAQQKLNKKRILVHGGGLSAPFWRIEPLCEFLKRKTNCSLIPLFHSKVGYTAKEQGLFPAQNREEMKRSREFLELQKMIQPMLKKEKLLEKLIYRGIDISNLCNQKLLWILREYLPSYWLDYLSIDRTFKSKGFDLLIAAAVAPSDTVFPAALHYFENARIPGLLIPHGATFCKYPEESPIKKAVNLLFPPCFSHFAVVGEFLRNRLIMSGKNKQNVKCTGNLEYCKTNKISYWKKKLFMRMLRLSLTKKTIVYFLSRATRVNRIDYINTAFDEKRQSVKDVIKLAKKLNCQLIIKSHPGFIKSKAWIDLWAKEGDYRVVASKRANPILFSIADIAIVFKSSIAIEALDCGVPTIIYSHDPREIVFFDEASSPLERFEQEDKKPFIRATGFDELLQICKKILCDRRFLQLVKEKCKFADPWVHHNRDGQQVKRIVEFMAEIV